MGKSKEVFSTFMSDKERSYIWWKAVVAAFVGSVLIYVSSFVLLFLPVQTYSEPLSYSTLLGLFYLIPVMVLVCVVVNFVLVRLLASRVNGSADLLYGPVKGFVFKPALFVHLVVWLAVFIFFFSFSFPAVFFAVVMSCVNALWLPVLFVRARNVHRPNLVRPSYE